MNLTIEKLAKWWVWPRRLYIFPALLHGEEPSREKQKIPVHHGTRILPRVTTQIDATKASNSVRSIEPFAINGANRNSPTGIKLFREPAREGEHQHATDRFSPAIDSLHRSHEVSYSVTAFTFNIRFDPILAGSMKNVNRNF